MRVKTSLLIDKKVWNDFKLLVQNKSDNSKKLSFFAEEALKSLNTIAIVEEFAKKYGISLFTYPSSKEIKQNRPKVKISAGKIVREMRNEREAHLLGF